jgi:hypothetical protein
VHRLDAHFSQVGFGDAGRLADELLDGAHQRAGVQAVGLHQVVAAGPVGIGVAQSQPHQLLGQALLGDDLRHC